LTELRFYVPPDKNRSFQSHGLIPVEILHTVTVSYVAMSVYGAAMTPKLGSWCERK